MQKNNIRQVICGQCGNWCDFECDKCPACGASLFGDEPTKDTKPNEEDKNDDQNQPKENANTNEQKPAELLDSNDSKTAQLSDSHERQNGDILLWIILIAIVVILLISMVTILFIL